MTLADFTAFHFSDEGRTFKVYKKGSGPGVLVMSEMPGISPAMVTFADRVISKGYTVWMPHLFGDDGRDSTPGYVASSLAQACVRSEFAALAAHRSSPVCISLRAMCRALHAEAGGKGVGAVGMCFTGNFALALMLEPLMLVPVLSQPSLPMLPFSHDRKAALHLSPDELAVCKKRTAAGDKILALRFSEDSLVPHARFQTLKREFGDACETFEIDSKPGNPHNIPRNAHSVLTLFFVDEPGHPTRQAMDRMFALFAERLL